MASGKTETGKQLARTLDYPFLDLDDLIVQESGLPIPELFSREGEAAFRKLESRLLKRTADRSQAVIATGGGAPCFEKGMNWINRHGFSIFLEVPAEELTRRLWAKPEDRPLIRQLARRQDLESFIAGLLRRREPVYRQAHLTVRALADPQEVAREIQKHWMQITGH